MIHRCGKVAFGLAWLLAVSSAVHGQRVVRGPAPEVAKLTTKDGVELSITYYPSRAAKDPAIGKQVTPVVLLHDEKDTQGMFASLAAKLQSAGQPGGQSSFAVVTVDLRGHGASTRQTAFNGQTRQLDAAKLNRGDLLAMSVQDMEAVRSFLVGKNDDGELNLNKLSLVGAGMGAMVAVNWAAEDWNAPPLAIGKQGQDVKALVLISPQWKFRGIPLQQGMRQADLKRNAAWLLIYGQQDSDQTADARRIYRQLEKYHPTPAATNGPPRRLVEMPYPSALEGSGMLSQLGTTIDDQIIAFLTAHVAEQELQWKKRRNILQ
jgi:pimeloyl-ACP methyl ester carboxylesterase